MGTTNLLSALMILILSHVSLGQELSFEIAEESPPGFLGNVAMLANLTSVLGHDDLSSLQYAIVDDSGDSPFFVDQTSGDLSTRTTLDREALCGTAICIVQGAVAVQSSSPISAFFRKFAVALRVLDINDHLPVFSQTSFVVNIPENAVTDTVFVLPTATDHDVRPEFKVQSYALEPRFEQFQLHVVRTTNALGDIQFVVSLKVVKSLDRETKQLFITTLVAFDGGHPPRRAGLPLSIDVMDKNDNAPKFDKLDYGKTLTEATARDSTVLMVSARDLDEGDNARVSYFLADSADSEVRNLFSISQDTGVIIVQSTLENRGGKTYQFKVVAQDNGVPVKKSVCRIVIKILDTVNDRPVIEVSPLFTHSVVVPETAAVGRVTSLLTVRDNDSGRNGIVSCQLDNAFFSLQRLQINEYKVIVAAPLDREKRANHTINIHCTDSGDPPLSTESVMYVEVSDSNDNKPTFANSDYVLSVAENEVVGTWVGQIRARDVDTGDNACLIYGMDDNGDTFTIDTMLGDIYTARFLDREAKPKYVFLVYAYDNSASPLTASTTVTVNVADKNDQRPVFTAPSYTFNLQERALPGSMVGRVKATDGDLGLNAQVEYYMVNAQPRPLFPIGVNLSGVVLVTGIVDYEASYIYSFAVTAVDMGTPRQNATCHVIVEVMDNNDHHPVITFPSPSNPSVVIPLDTAPGTEIAKVVAYDLDSGPNGALHYAISLANVSSLFFIDDVTGVITLGNQILPGDVRSYNVVISVSDNGIPQMAQQALLQIDVTAYSGSVQHSSTNLKLVIALVCLTLLLALAVLTPLLFIYCFNRRRSAQEKHRHEILSRPGYQPERLERLAGNLTTTIFTSHRDDTAVYSPDRELKIKREYNRMYSPKPDFTCSTPTSGLQRQCKKEISPLNSPDFPYITEDTSVYRLERDVTLKGENPTSVRENLAALHCPKKTDVTVYSCEGRGNTLYQCLETKTKKKSVSFENERHPSIMEEQGDLPAHEIKSVRTTLPMQAIEEYRSPNHFSTFKPPQRPGRDEQQSMARRRDADEEEWNSSSTDTSDSGHGGSEIDMSSVKIQCVV